MERPATFCESCRLAEMTPWQRLRERLRPDYLRIISVDMSGLIAAAVGTRPRTAYDRHRELYMNTGDALEFERMMRHVQ